MADDYTDEDVEKRQESIEKLRAEVLDAKAGVGLDLNAEANKVTMAALDAEEERLRAELEYHRSMTTKKAVNEATGGVIEQIKAAQATEPTAQRTRAKDKE